MNELNVSSVSYSNLRNLLCEQLRDEYILFRDELRQVLLEKALPLQVLPEQHVTMPNTALGPIELELRSSKGILPLNISMYTKFNPFSYLHTSIR